MTLPLPVDDALDAARRHGATDLRVFGSFARGDAGPESDLDVLVRFLPGRTLVDAVALQRDLEALARRPVDVVSEGALADGVRERVLAAAVPLAAP